MTKDQRLMQNSYVAKTVRSYGYGMINLIEAVTAIIQYFKSNDILYSEATEAIKLLSKIKIKYIKR